jgi:hypothetical protein
MRLSEGDSVSWVCTFAFGLAFEWQWVWDGSDDTIYLRTSMHLHIVSYSGCEYLIRSSDGFTGLNAPKMNFSCSISQTY